LIDQQFETEDDELAELDKDEFINTLKSKPKKKKFKLNNPYLEHILSSEIMTEKMSIFQIIGKTVRVFSFPPHISPLFQGLGTGKDLLILFIQRRSGKRYVHVKGAIAHIFIDAL